MEGRHYMTHPTDKQLRALAAYYRYGSYKDAAAQLGIAPHTLAVRLQGLYLLLGVYGAVAAAHALGWVQIPSGVYDG